MPNATMETCAPSSTAALITPTHKMNANKHHGQRVHWTGWTANIPALLLLIFFRTLCHKHRFGHDRHLIQIIIRGVAHTRVSRRVHNSSVNVIWIIHRVQTAPWDSRSSWWGLQEPIKTNWNRSAPASYSRDLSAGTDRIYRDHSPIGRTRTLKVMKRGRDQRFLTESKWSTPTCGDILWRHLVSQGNDKTSIQHAAAPAQTHTCVTAIFNPE